MVNATGARRSGWGRRAAVGALVLCAVADAALLAKYVSDDAVLEQAIELDRDLPPSQKVLAALDFIETRVAKGLTTDESFLPGLSFLRPTARQVLEKGGDCADRSRLLIELLKREGVSASKVALHDQDGIPRHSVVQAQVEDADGSMVVDALFGIYFPDEKGGYHSVWDVQHDETILSNRLEAVASRQPYTRDYPIDVYTYEAPKSINWSKSWTMQRLYGVLYRVMGSEVDKLPRPSIVGDPVLLTLVTAAGGQASVLLALVLVKRRRRRGLGSSRPA